MEGLATGHIRMLTKSGMSTIYFSSHPVIFVLAELFCAVVTFAAVWALVHHVRQDSGR